MVFLESEVSWLCIGQSGDTSAWCCIFRTTLFSSLDSLEKSGPNSSTLSYFPFPPEHNINLSGDNSFILT